METLITILTIDNLNSDNLCDLTINSDTGQHSQFFQCLVEREEKVQRRFADSFQMIKGPLLSKKQLGNQLEV